MCRKSEVVSWFRIQEMCFGLGWALTGACPGPLVALVGNGISVMLVAIASAVAGTWTYGCLRPKLPH